MVWDLSTIKDKNDLAVEKYRDKIERAANEVIITLGLDYRMTIRQEQLLKDILRKYI